MALKEETACMLRRQRSDGRTTLALLWLESAAWRVGWSQASGQLKRDRRRLQIKHVSTSVS